MPVFTWKSATVAMEISITGTATPADFAGIRSLVNLAENSGRAVVVPVRPKPVGAKPPADKPEKPRPRKSLAELKRLADGTRTARDLSTLTGYDLGYIRFLSLRPGSDIKVKKKGAKYTREIVEAAAKDAKSISDFGRRIGCDRGHANRLLARYGLSDQFKARPSWRNEK